MGDLVPVILSGGAGARLWPHSRELQPKPFLRLGGAASLLQQTYARAAALPDVRSLVTVTNRDHLFQSRDELAAALKGGIPLPSRFLLEPAGRNTAPAAALAALSVADVEGPDAILLLLPADHLITHPRAFAGAVAKACAVAARGQVAVFGIPPTAPETGFGYLHAAPGGERDATRPLIEFVEKPDAARAMEFLASGDYYWNSGMFCLQARTLLALLERHAASLLEQARRCWADGVAERTVDTTAFEAAAFGALPSVSIDCAVMERLACGEAAIVPMPDAGWSDVGTWDALCRVGDGDAHGNRVLGEAVLIDVEHSLVASEQRMVAALGVRNLVIVDTPDALLVADRGHAQEVRRVVDELRRRGHESVRLHRTVHRPWGSYTVLEEGPRFKIKRIVVRPGASLSLQKHHHRSEHWVVISGIALVVNGASETLVRADESTYIAAGTPHRLSNPGKVDCVIIEVQSGDYVGEDDIVRLQDAYGRATGPAPAVDAGAS